MNAADVFFRWVLQTSWQAAVLVGLILLGQRIFRRHVSPGWRYGLWSLLVVRLVLPVPLPSPVSIFDFAWLKPASHAWVLVPTMAIGSAAAQQPALHSPASVPTPKLDERIPSAGPSPRSGPPSLPPDQGAGRTWTWFEWAFAIWIGGTGLLLLRLVWSNARFQSRIRRQSPVADPVLKREFARCQEVFALKQDVTLIETSLVDSPAVYGFRQKYLLLPLGIVHRFTRQELRYIFLHELAHLKRRDLELNWLAVLLQIVHWFNPVLWFGFTRMRADREIATDAMVLSRTEGPEHTPYGETVIKLAESLTGPGAAPALVGIAEDKREIQRRIRQIARGQGGRPWPYVSVGLLVLVGACACTDLLQPAPGATPGVANGVLGEAEATSKAQFLISQLKARSRWTFGPKAILFGDEDGEVSGGMVRSVQIRNYAMAPGEVAALGRASAPGLPPASVAGSFIQWDFAGNLASVDGRSKLVPRAARPAKKPDFSFILTTIGGDATQVLRFSAGTGFELANPFKAPDGKPSMVDYTVIMDIMFPEMKSRWAALWQTDPKNLSDAEWLISTEKGIGITDNYGGRVPEGEWHRVALVLRGSEALFTSFIDGEEVQRKRLDVKDEYYNRRRDEDVLQWTDTLVRLRDLHDPSAETALEKFNLRLQNGARATPQPAPPTFRPGEIPRDSAGEIASLQARAAQQTTMALVAALQSKSRWTLGPQALLFADENGENAGGLIDALQVRNYAMTEEEVARLEGHALSQDRDARAPSDAQIAQWDFNGHLNSSAGGLALVPVACSPAQQPEVQFESRKGDPAKPEVARFSRGTYFELGTGFGGDQAHRWLLNYSVIMDVRFDERPVGWVSLWQNDAQNRTDADWFVNKKGQLGIRDFYGGSVEDRAWNRLALVVDGRTGRISHFINGRKVRSKLIILEDEYSRRGGAERSLNFIVALISELRLRNETAASDLVRSFSQRMHNHADPESAARFIPLNVQVTDKDSSRALPDATIDYQTGESNEDFFPGFVKSGPSGYGLIQIPIPVAERVHLTAHAPGYSAGNVTVPGAEILDGTARSVHLDLARSVRIGGTLTGPDGVPVSKAVVRILVGDGAATGFQVRPWSELVQTTVDGRWQVDWVPADVRQLTLVFYHDRYPTQAFSISREDSIFGDLKNLNAQVRLGVGSK